MKACPWRFNINLRIMGMILLGLACGCKTTSSKNEKPATLLRFYAQTNPYGPEDHLVATVGRSIPFQVAVRTQPFLTEIYVMEASVVKGVGGVEIAVRFDKEGSWILEQYTASYMSRHFAIYSQFGQERWLAAPVVTRRISDGVFRFTPDATEEEVMRIVEGLQEVAKEVREENRY